jgi:exopolysaccharide/PEP-CTERM locus tyrosine autokinase
LETDSQQSPKASARSARASTDALAPSVIERAVSDKSAPSDLAAAGLGAKPQSASPGRKLTRPITIDLDRLRKQSIIVPGDQRTSIAESFRRIKRPILANVATGEPGTAANLVMVTSPTENAGKTFCAINLAISMAMELDRTVMLVDADIVKRSIPAVFGVKVEKGLMDCLLNRNMDLADVLFRTNIDKLTILAAGRANQYSAELLASETMHMLLREMADRYRDRIVVFDSPPLLRSSEAAVLASRMGQIVMVVEAWNSTGPEVKEALGRIESCSRISLILNKGEDLGSYSLGGHGR